MAGAMLVLLVSYLALVSAHGDASFYGTKPEKPGYENIQAMGRSFSLGYLYDIRGDKIISKSLWDLEDLQQNVHEESALSTRFDVAMSETINDKASLMDLSANIKASFLSGMISVSGSAKYMDSRKSHSRVTAVTLKSERKSKTRRLSMNHLGKIKYPDVLDEDDATHVIAGITYGANAYFRFEKTLKESDNKNEIAGTLGVSVRSIPSFSVEGNGTLDLEESQRDFVDDLRVEFFGDYDVSPPTTYEGAVKVVQELYNREQVDDVPMIVDLVPLHTLTTKADVMVRKLSVQAVEDISEALMYLDEAGEDLDELLLYRVSTTFPEYSQFINDIKGRFRERALHMRGQLSDLLPKIRSAEKDENELLSMVKEFETSIFTGQYFKPWLQQQREELKLFNVISEQLKFENAHEGHIYEEHTYEAVLGHALRAGSTGAYVINACLIASADKKLVDMLDFKKRNTLPSGFRYPVHDNYWAGMKQIQFQSGFFQRVSALRNFAKSNHDVSAMRFVTYIRYMCDVNEATTDYHRFASKVFTDIDLGIELKNLDVDYNAKQITWKIVRFMNEDHEVNVELQYKNLETGIVKVAVNQLPNHLAAGRYVIDARVVAVGGGHGDWHRLQETVEVKVCGTKNCLNCGWNGLCLNCEPGFDLQSNGKCGTDQGGADCSIDNCVECNAAGTACLRCDANYKPSKHGYCVTDVNGDIILVKSPTAPRGAENVGHADQVDQYSCIVNNEQGQFAGRVNGAFGCYYAKDASSYANSRNFKWVIFNKSIKYVGNHGNRIPAGAISINNSKDKYLCVSSEDYQRKYPGWARKETAGTWCYYERSFHGYSTPTFDWVVAK